MTISPVSLSGAVTSWLPRTRLIELTAVLAALASGLLIGIRPQLAVIAVALFLGSLWLLTRRAQLVATLTSAGALLLLVAVPAGRLATGTPLGQLNSLVPAAVAGLALLAVARIGIPKALSRPLLGLVALLVVEALATSRVEDAGEWQAYVLTSMVPVATVVLGGVVAVTGVWPRVRTLLVVLAATEAGIAIVEVLTFRQPLWRGAKILPDGTSIALPSQFVAGVPRAQGTLAHPLTLSMLLLVALVLIYRDELLPRMPRMALTLLMFGGLVASGSRNALLFGAMIVLLRGGRRLTARLPVMVGAGAFLAVLALQRITELLGDIAASGSYTHRAGALEALQRLVTERDSLGVLIGDGSGSILRLFHQGLLQQDGFFAVDNQVVLTVAEDGILGLAILVFILLYALRSSRNGVRAALVVCLLQFAILDVLDWFATGFLVWLLVGVACGRKSPEVDPQQLEQDRPVALSA